MRMIQAMWADEPDRWIDVSEVPDDMTEPQALAECYAEDERLRRGPSSHLPKATYRIATKGTIQ